MERVQEPEEDAAERRAFTWALPVVVIGIGVTIVVLAVKRVKRFICG